MAPGLADVESEQHVLGGWLLIQSVACHAPPCRVTPHSGHWHMLVTRTCRPAPLLLFQALLEGAMKVAADAYALSARAIRDSSDTDTQKATQQEALWTATKACCLAFFPACLEPAWCHSHSQRGRAQCRDFHSTTFDYGIGRIAATSRTAC